MSSSLADYASRPDFRVWVARCSWPDAEVYVFDSEDNADAFVAIQDTVSDWTVTEEVILDADFVREHTGFAIGGVAPVGHSSDLPTLVDEALAAYEVIWAAAGHPHAVFPTTFDELVRISGGQAAEVAEEAPDRVTARARPTLGNE